MERPDAPVTRPSSSNVTALSADAGERRRHVAGGWSLRTRDVIASLVALATVGIAQPLLDLIGRNAAFLVAHEAGRLEVVALALGLPVVLPLILAGVVLLLKRAAAPVAAVVHALMVGTLGGILMLVVLRVSDRGGALPTLASFAVAAAAGVVVVLGYRASPVLRRLLMAAAITAPVVAAMFLFATPARALVFPTVPEDAATQVPGDAPPIVVVAFDELPTASLLTADGDIDAEAFPNFNAFAQDATFFRNTTAVHGQTSDAIPAALSGRYPRAESLPIAGDHPQNLFALLAPTYDLHVIEPLTQLCPAGRCRSAPRDGAHYRALVRDLAVVGSHLVLPEPLTEGLPPIDQGWRDFAADAAVEGKEGAVRDRFREARESDPAPEFEAFVDDVRPADRPTLHFIHTLLPHSPWRYLPDGRRHSDDWYASGLEKGRWARDEWRVTQGYQRHLVQLQLADRLLGTLIDKLNDSGLYDDSLVVVMVDHGASFTPGESLRMMDRGTFGEIGAVPLLVKPPGQRNGEVSDRPLEIVDIMPTILDVIGATPPDGTDGRSAFDRSRPERTSKRFFSAYGPLTFDPQGDEKWPVVERKAERFAAGAALAFPYNLTPEGYEDLLGRATARVRQPAAHGLSVTLDSADAYAALDLGAPVVPSHLHGTVRGVADEPPILAIGVNGTIVAVTRADLEGGPARRFRALLPPESLIAGKNTIEVFVVDRAGSLTPVAQSNFG